MKRSWFVISVLVFLFAAVAYITAPYPTADFYDNFYKAARYVLSGHSPYDSIYIGAPWGVIPLIPFALLPPSPRMDFILRPVCSSLFILRGDYMQAL